MNIIPDAIVQGDNLEWLPLIPDESIDMCYIDPPFCTNRDFIEFNDKFLSIHSYIEWMRPRIELIHKKLKKTGSIFLHCDWHASHRLRCLLDDVFGEKNLKNEIIWSYGAKATPQKNMFPKKHDTIFFYTKSSKYYFRPIMVEYSEASLRERATRYKFFDESGHYRLTTRRKTNGEKYRAKVYLNDGVPETDVWNIPIINATSNERLGYPTQKPEALIKRIIECSTNEGDVVLDCFAGGGTTAKVAKDLNRRYIVGDISANAVNLTKKRLHAE